MPCLPDQATIRVWARLLRTQSQLLRSVKGALDAAGQPPLAWYDVLLELHRDRDSGLRQFEIGERVLLPKHNLSRLIDRLQREGLVRRQSCPEDGRGNVVRITDAGEALLRKMWPVYGGAIQDRFGSRLTADEIQVLGEILGKLLSGPNSPSESN